MEIETETQQIIAQDQGDFESMLTVDETAPAAEEGGLTAAEAQTVAAFNQIQDAIEVKKAAKPKKPTKKEVMLKEVPEGQQLYYNKFAPCPYIGCRVRVFDSHVWEDGKPVQGKYGMGPCIIDSKVKSTELSEDGTIVKGCTAESGEVFELKRTGLWNLVTDKKIKKPHKRNIVRFGDRYDEISTEALMNIKNASTKKRKTERELKAIERKKAKVEEAKIKKVTKKAAPAPKKAKPAAKKQKKVESDSESSDSDSSSEEDTTSAEDPNLVAGEILVDQIVEKVTAIIETKLQKFDKILGKRKRDSEEKPAQKIPRKKSKPSPKKH